MDSLVALSDFKNEHGGSAPAPVAKHHDLLASQIDCLVAYQADQSIIERACVDVTQLLG